METVVDRRPFLRRPVKQPLMMAYLPFVMLICELLYLIDVSGLMVAALVIIFSAMVGLAIALNLNHKLNPLPPLPGGFVVSMWIVVIAYPVYVLFIIVAAIEIFSR